MNKFRFLQSFELLSFLISQQPLTGENASGPLLDLAEMLDKHFSSSDFSLIATKDQSGIEQNDDQNDALFLNPYAYKFDYLNLQILTEKEAVILYTCLIGWMRKINLNADLSLIKRMLIIHEDVATLVDQFFSSETTGFSLNAHEIFMLSPKEQSSEELEGSWIEDNKPENDDNINQLQLSQLEIPVKCLYIDTFKIFFLRTPGATHSLTKNDRISLCHWEDLQPGDRLSVDQKFFIDYYDLKRRFVLFKEQKKLELQTKGLVFTHPNGKGLKSLDLHIDQGCFMGLLGKEGCGKSTLLRLLAGDLPYTGGNISVNGYELKQNLYQLKAMIGYVPEQDLLYDELTVYENLYLAAKLYLGKQKDAFIMDKVEQLLTDLDLQSVRRQLVGSIQDKYLQPGQRRLLNVALEMLRDPHILIVDNALAPLSAGDSAKVIQVLSDYAFRGNIVITSITNTHTDALLHFDQLLVIDDGGFPVYNGKPIDVNYYFCSLFALKPKSGQYMNADEILQLIGRRKRTGNPQADVRFRSPLELYRAFGERHKEKPGQKRTRRFLPENLIRTPRLEQQYAIFSLRNFKTKIARTRELIFTLLIAPFFALIIAAFLRETPDEIYSFHFNRNIPEFFFTGIVFSILIGLLLSANEIIKERAITRKNEYLNLSRFSYINSKISFLFALGLLQSFLFAAISTMILEIRSSFLVIGLVFFSCHSFGVLLGLLFSATHRHIENIYTRSIPLVILLQIIFGGGFIDLSNYSTKSKNYTPVIADLIVARWAYEAILVDQFIRNDYNRNFYAQERKMVQSAYHAEYLIPYLEELVDKYETPVPDIQQDSLHADLRKISEVLTSIPRLYDVFPYENIHLIQSGEFTPEIGKDLTEYLEYLKIYFMTRWDNAEIEKEMTLQRLEDSLGTYFSKQLYLRETNLAIEREVTDADHPEIILTQGGTPVQAGNNIYQYPESQFGRAPMFLPEKLFADQMIQTVEFNLSVTWLFNLLLYVLLVSNLHVKIVNRRER